MPIPVTCECGKSYSVKEELAGKTVRCKVCGDPLRIPTADDIKELVKESGQYLTQTKTTEEATIRCANCGRSMPKTLEKCRYCGKPLRKSMKRTFVIIAASAVVVLLLIVVIIVFLVPSRGEVVRRQAVLLAEYIRQKSWEGVYELDRAKVTGRNSAEYVEKLTELFADLDITDIFVSEPTIDPDTDCVFTEFDVRAMHKTAKKSFKNKKPFRVEWKEENGVWLAYLGTSRIYNELGDYVRASIVKPESTCGVCRATGRTRCPSCGGKGKLGDGTFCRDCYRSQGWQPCSICKGTGKSTTGEE
ncbi:MAG: hypothetical protein E3J72_02055 [Planctomycetota bacterium]|nr:MAG: hypothetical protein E3J72_02055 [Planctomycetota bacterium]